MSRTLNFQEPIVGKKSQYEAMQEIACAKLTELLARQHPEWKATLTFRHGQVVIEAEDAVAVRAWLEEQNRKPAYATGNQSHLYGASHRSRLPASVHDTRSAEDVGDEIVEKNKDYRGEVPERMDVDSRR